MRNVELSRILTRALREDKAWNDATTQSLKRSPSAARAVVRAQEKGILAGVAAAAAVFRVRDRRLQIKTLIRDGSLVGTGRVILSIQGPASSILSAERTALNLLSHLSGIATLTRRFVEAVRGTDVPIYDTRKTTPGLRTLEKEAVKSGGGHNHRMNLAEAVLLKDNHLKAMRRAGDSASECLRRLRHSRFRNKIVEMEAQNLEEVWEAIAAGVDIILLDNLKPPILEKALRLVRSARKNRSGSYPQAEVSGGVNLSNVRAVADLKPDRISVGMITHSAPALDFNLDIL